jgi:hypothetical protein
VRRAIVNADHLNVGKKNNVKRYMVIEQFAPGDAAKIYKRYHEKGRMLPDGLVYLDSWLTRDGDRCFQLMETDDHSLFSSWTGQWKDLVKFEIIELGDKPRNDA